MTAAELMLQLQTLPPDTKIVVRGYEDGYNDIINLRPVKIKLISDAPWYEGAFKDSTDTDAIDAVDLFGVKTPANTANTPLRPPIPEKS